ncbi:TIGR03085 family metal-binding protein [Janibacter corallicola]|uniref:TIGR03085 family metal-binding protein n=1 Tax=Janibacter corallicola TaxID=415212 RepID=UPI000830FA4F|nr:TIGR03085 family metal-binding protein [Janibacter corallicola]
MTRHAQTERQALCQTLLDAGPEESTLCSGWTTGDLAAHLVVREGRPDRAAGVVVKALAERSARAMRQLRERHSHEEIVEQIRQGPPKWSPARVPAIDEQLNLVEMFVHHEDVLRAHLAAPRRSPSTEFVAALGDRLALMGPMLFRKVPGVDIEVVTAVRHQRVRRGNEGDPVVQVHGRPGEVLLFGFGRTAVAEVELIGPPDAVETLRTARLGV